MSISKAIVLSVALLAAHLVPMRSARADDAGPAAPASPPVASHTELKTQFSVMAGLTQWLLFRGGNLALELKVGRLVFEASHGQGLDLNQLPGLALTAAERGAGAHVLVPWTTGFGVGFRVTENFHLLVEAKAHHYEVTGRDRNSEVDYTTFSVGPGAFYSIYLYEGLFLEPTVRWWPNVASTLSGNHAVIRQSDGTTYDHAAHDFGLFANVSLGYTF
jgi:hypothetical protein